LQASANIGLKKTLLEKLYQVMTFVLVIWVVCKFDVVMLKSGEVITNTRFENWIYKICGVTVISTFHGSDSRPAFLRPRARNQTIDLVHEQIKRAKERVVSAGEISDFIIDNPLSAHNHERKICNWQVIANGIADSKLNFSKENHIIEQIEKKLSTIHQEQILKIAHIPSDGSLKGSKEILQAIKELQDDGYVFEFTSISGITNREVLETLAVTDIVVDELYSDAYGAILAQEACCFGCAVIVCGYGAQELEKYSTAETRLPTMFSHPSKVKDAILELLTNETKRQALSKKAIEYTNNYGSCRAVASRLVTLASRKAPNSWFFNPDEIEYLSGVAGPENKIAESIREQLEHYGPQGLFMDDKPRLRDALMNFASKEI